MTESDSRATQTLCGYKKCFMIVGLGNPGPRYAKTRHNVGFEVIEAISCAFIISLKMHPANARIGGGRIQGREVVLVQPLAYMNLSGNPVYQLAQSFGLSCE
ncbi:MAG: hypothetical protein Q7U40_07510, partial [Desulfatirhabdiaceae bacterium]|nr:hypothetical protein [Desulfatirhabdiaceae bacterium]